MKALLLYEHLTSTNQQQVLLGCSTIPYIFFSATVMICTPAPAIIIPRTFAAATTRTAFLVTAIPTTTGTSSCSLRFLHHYPHHHTTLPLSSLYPCLPPSLPSSLPPHLCLPGVVLMWRGVLSPSLSQSGLHAVLV